MNRIYFLNLSIGHESEYISSISNSSLCFTSNISERLIFFIGMSFLHDVHHNLGGPSRTGSVGLPAVEVHLRCHVFLYGGL